MIRKKDLLKKIERLELELSELSSTVEARTKAIVGYNEQEGQTVMLPPYLYGMGLNNTLPVKSQFPIFVTIREVIEQFAKSGMISVEVIPAKPEEKVISIKNINGVTTDS